MACCNNSNIQSTAKRDWCTNCNYSFDYNTNKETGHWTEDEPVKVPNSETGCPECGYWQCAGC